MEEQNPNGGYNNPIDGRRNEFKVPQQPISRMAYTTGIGQNTFIDETVGTLGSVDSRNSGRVPVNMGTAIAPDSFNSRTNVQQQHNQMLYSTGAATVETASTSRGLSPQQMIAGLNVQQHNLMVHSTGAASVEIASSSRGLSQQQMIAGLNVQHQHNQMVHSTGAASVEIASSSRGLSQQQMLTGLNVPHSSQQRHLVYNFRALEADIDEIAAGSHNPQPDPDREPNMYAILLFGQLAVQTITEKCEESFQLLMNIKLERKGREADIQRNIGIMKLLVEKVRSVYEECIAMKDDVPGLIPYKGEPDNPNQSAQSAKYQRALQENEELIATVKLRNEQLRKIIEFLRETIFEINTMLAMRLT